MSGWNNANKWIGVVLLFVIVMAVFPQWGFPWWMLFFIFPMFGGWGHEERYERPSEKAKREYDEKSKRDYLDMDTPTRDEPRYAIGDDGELVELPPDDEKPKRRSEYV